MDELDPSPQERLVALLKGKPFPRKAVPLLKDGNYQRDATIAALSGAGIASSAIAEAVGLTPKGVEVVLATKVAKDPDLQAILEEGRERVAKEALGLAEITLRELRDRVENGQTRCAGIDHETGLPVMVTEKVPAQHLATVFREIRPAIGIGEREKSDGSLLHLEIDINNPEVAAAIAIALRDGRRALEARTIEAERVD